MDRCKTLGEVIPGPFQPKSTPPECKEILEWMKNRRNIVLAVGRLDRVKQFDRLILAFRSLREKCRTGLVIVGDGPERDKLKNLVSKLGLSDDCRFAGTVLEPRYFMAESSCLAITSESEGFPNVILEAFSCLLPVVSFAWTERNEFPVPAGCRVVMVSQGDTEKLASTIHSVLKENSSKENMGKNIFDFRKEKQSGTQSTDYEKVFLEMVVKRGGASSSVAMSEGQY